MATVAAKFVRVPGLQRPGPQPCNQIAPTLAEQIRRASVPRRGGPLSTATLHPGFARTNTVAGIRDEVLHAVTAELIGVLAEIRQRLDALETRGAA